MKSFTRFLFESQEVVDRKKKEQNQPQQTVQTEPQQPQQEKPKSDTLTLTFGRFNPPHVGHGKLIDKTAEVAGEGGDYRIYPSRTQNAAKNPLPPKEKVEYMKKLYPQHSMAIQDDDNVKSIINALEKAHKEGYKNINLVVGDDRVDEFQNLVNKYNKSAEEGGLYQFGNINIQSAGERKEAESQSDTSVESMSASRMRKAAASGNFDEFRSGLPSYLDQDTITQLYNAVRKYMKVSESTELWDIAPKLDKVNLQESYRNKKLFPIGSLVESMNTGLVGKVIRTGVNYVIALTEDNIVFRSWIYDIDKIN